MPIKALRSFPLVTELSLRHIAGLTVVKLAALARTSPLLTSLDLEWSMWESETLELDGVERPLIAALNRFKNLETLNLGYLPVAEDDPWEIECIIEWAEEKGIELEWQGADSNWSDGDESDQGSFHDG